MNSSSWQKNTKKSKAHRQYEIGERPVSLLQVPEILSHEEAVVESHVGKNLFSVKQYGALNAME